MLDRLTNLLVLFILAAALIVLSNGIWNAWNTTAAWEQVWVAKPEKHSPYPAEKLLTGIQKATEFNEHEDAAKLEAYLKEFYDPSGTILVHLSWPEIREVAIASLLTLLLLIVPVSLNYVRHGKFRIWNQRT